MSVKIFEGEALGQFYLGKEYDAEARVSKEAALLYDSKDLVTHGVVLGMTGSGKTGLCLALLEEAAMDHIPAIVIDPKGDISNLLLTFPELDGQSFEPWVNADDAAKKGISVQEHAANIAAMWKKGLEESGQSGNRIAQLRENVDINIFTPGSSAGIPVSILSSLAVPSKELMEDSELLVELVTNTVDSLLTLVGVSSGNSDSKEAILLANIFMQEWKQGRALTLEALISLIQRPGFGKIGVIDLETFYPQSERQAFSMKLNGLIASPGFGVWLEGAPLDIAKMLHRDDGKPRISIFSIAHLGDQDRMFFVSLLLNQMLGWMRTQPGTTSLRALLYMDEIFGFLPPSANPPSKRPMMTLLKQARAYGLGCLLATQNPVDLDYKALSNIGTWFLGRLQTERDKLRVLDGLEGAAGAQNAQFNRKEMEALLSGLGNRVFLMNNVHEDAPVLFQVRWAMSYLVGPLTRSQIKSLMEGKRSSFIAASNDISADSNPMARASAVSVARPILGEGVLELFASPKGDVLEPYLFREATVHFSINKSNSEGSRKITKLTPMLDKKIDWEKTESLSHEGLVAEPEEGAIFSELPSYAMSAKNYEAVKKEFSDELYREERAEVLSCPDLKVWSKFGETEGEFRVRVSHEARQIRDEALEKIRNDAQKKIASLEDKLRTTEAQLSKEKAEASAAKMQVGISLIGGILQSVLGRKIRLSSLSSGASSINKATSAYKQHQDVSRAEDKLESGLAEIEIIRTELEKQLAQISQSFDPAALVLEKESIKPTRADVKVERVCLVWC